MYILLIHPEVTKYDETAAYMDAAFSQEQTGLRSEVNYVSCSDCGIRVTVETRRDFALLSALLKRAEKAGLGVLCHGKDTTTIHLKIGTADFWEFVARAQMWFKVPNDH